MATTLQAGDIAIVGFNFDNPDEFAFVILKDISIGTQIKFTDNGWLSSGRFRNSEGIYTWTANQDYKVGTVINVSNSGLAFASSGDQIIAYQGIDSNPNLIYALNSEGSTASWQSNAVDAHTSALPKGLIDRKTAVALSEIDNAIYTGTTSGTKDELLAAIGNPANWSGSDTVRQTIPTTSFNIISLTAIYNIQGAGHSSSFAGQSVTTRGVVTALANNGFYIQDAVGDGNAATSDGIFVFTRSLPSVVVGNSVEVKGTVTEFQPGGATSQNLTLTQITNPTITSLGASQGSVAPTIVGAGGRVIPTEIIDNDKFATFDPAQDGIDFYESLEGMLIQVNDAVAVSPSNDYGEVWVVANNGANATGMNSRGGITIRDGGTVNPFDDFNPERLQIDDTLYRTPLTVNVGDKLGSIKGVIDYSFGNYELLPSIAPTVTAGGLGKETTNLVGTQDKLAIANYNVENLDPGDGSRFDLIAAQMVNNLKSPDVIALQEIQDNDGPTNSTVVDASLTYQTLIAAIARAGGPQYQYFDIPPIDDRDGGEPGGNIRVGYLYRSDRVSINPNSAQRIGENNAAFDATRKSLYTQFQFNGQTIHFINNHLSSKGGSSPLFGSTQPYINGNEEKRNAQAQTINNFIQGILQNDPNAKVVVSGDLNEFQFNSPVQTLKGNILTNLTDTLPENERYSYNFEGNSQQLDHILVSQNLVNGAEYDVVHINSQFAAQTSDHDPLLTLLSFSGPVNQLSNNLSLQSEIFASSLSSNILSDTSLAPIAI